MKTLLITFLVLCLCCCTSPSKGQFSFYNPEIFHTDKNLPQTHIDNIVQDNDGFLWISGRNGIQRFDGSHFQQFLHDPNDSTSIVDNETKGCFFDKEENKLWIPTRKGGLSVMDIKTGKCKNYYHDPDRPSKLPNSRLRLAFKDRQKNIWVSVNNYGILKYQPETDDFKIFKHQPKKLFGEDSSQNLENMANLIQCYAEDINKDSILWFGTLAGLLKFNKVKGTFERFSFTNSNKTFIEINHILTIYSHQNGKLYLGTYKGGLTIFDPIKKTFEQASITGKTKVEKTGENDIRAIFPKSSNELWVTCRTGLGIFNVDENRSVAYFENNYFKEEAYGIKFIDNQGRFYTWGLYYKGGDQTNKDYLFIFDPKRHQTQFYPYLPISERRYLLTTNFLEKKDTNKLWVTGTLSEGLYEVDLQSGEWKTYPPPLGYFKKHQNFQGREIIQLQTGDILLLTDETIYQVDESKNELQPYRLQPNLPNAQYRTFSQDKKGRIWIGTYFGGLVRINPTTNQIKFYRDELNPPEIKNHSSAIWTLAIDRNDNVWFRASKGYSVYHAKKDSFYHFPNFYHHTNERIGVQMMATDSEGKVWMNSERHQVIGITNPDHPEKGILEYLDQSNGIQLKRPTSLIADVSGNIWQGGTSLEKINPADFKASLFSNKYLFDGKIWSLGSLSNGKVITGFKSGFGVFHPDSLQLNSEFPKPYLTSFKVFDKELELDQSLYAIKDIYLHPDQNFFSFNFSSLGFTNAQSINYLYRLEGFDSEWIDPKERRYAAYTNVPFGKYILKIKAINNEGYSNNKPFEVTIHIHTPWHLTSWAYLLYFITLCIFIYSIFYFRNRRKELHLQLVKEQEEADRLKEMDNFKTTFFTNITHEFRTPLTVIQGMADELKGNAKAKELILNNSHQLLKLINQLLDLSKVESGAMAMNWIQIDIINYLNYITESLQTYAFSKKINFTFYSELESLKMDVDLEKMQSILLNLISNAIKFTPEYGKILIIGNKKIIDDQSTFEIKITDTGIGIPSKTLPNIFNRFFQIENTKSHGTGIGLALVKELIEMHHGKISVESLEEKGTTFTLSFPVTQNAPVVETFSKNVSNVNHVSSTYKKSKITTKTTSLIPNFELPKLLVIEDNYDVVQYLSAILNKKYEIIIAKNGSAGIDKALLEIPDIIISDVMMPEKDGFEVCDTLKQDERTSHIPIILLTAKATTKDKIEGLQFGADAYLMKPFNKNELLVRLEKLLELRKNLQARFSHFSIKENNSFLSIEDKFLKKLNKIIDTHLKEEDFTTPFLCKKMGMSNSQLYRKLKAITGFSIANYIRYRRLLNAHQMIESSNEMINEIAFQCGFSNLSWFSQSFKDTFGYSPNELRN